MTRLKLQLQTTLAKGYVSSLHVTLNQPPPGMGIIALWHQDLAMAMKVFAGKGIRVLLSPSRDGEIAAKCAEALGYRVWRGSSSHRGSHGLRTLIREHRQAPHCIGMALDGPRGPRFQVKPGTLWLSQHLDLPIYPLGIAVRRFVQMERSWDHARLPYPFLGKAFAFLGAPLYQPQAVSLQSAMTAARQMAESHFFSNQLRES